MWLVYLVTYFFNLHLMDKKEAVVIARQLKESNKSKYYASFIATGGSWEYPIQYDSYLEARELMLHRSKGKDFFIV